MNSDRASDASNPKPTLHIRGRIDTDLIGVTQSAANKATFGDLKDEIGLRRTRIGVEGNFTPDSRYVAEIDLASGDVVIRDVFFGLGQVQDDGEIKVGHMREPFSLEGGTSANTFAFMERSAINSLDPARNWGVLYARCLLDEHGTVSAGVFKSGTDSNDFQGGDGSDSAATGRMTWLPWYESQGRKVIHLGVAVSARLPDNGVVVINQNPNSPLLDLGDSSTSPFVSKIRLPATSQQLFNTQWAFVNGPFSAQAEWYGTLINQSGGTPVFFHGGYASASYFLTGDHRKYLARTGVFGPVDVARPFVRGFTTKESPPQLGMGAWELTARASYLDFFDSNNPTGSQGQLVGTKLPQFTLGLNWYLADRCRILFNYTYSVPDEPNTGSSSANLFASRLSIFW